MGRSVDEFFRDIEGNSEEGKVLPNWWVLLLFGPSQASYFCTQAWGIVPRGAFFLVGRMVDI
jgi:hypothetical protein